MPMPDDPPSDQARLPRLVLCVDDEPLNRALVARLLERGGRFRVTAASTGHECLKLARELHPAVILLDWMLPDMSGGAVLAELAADPATAAIPVVVLSGLDRSDVQAAPETGEAQAQHYLGKPFSIADLVAVVEGATGDR